VGQPSEADKLKIEGYIQLAIDEGAELVIDGRGRSLPGHEEGFFLWPTLIDYATPSMKSYQDEILGPVAADHSYGSRIPGYCVANSFCPFALSQRPVQSDR
jgi:acyl-CoA reductase-like NAD-dependent aldehyde dehydrogenase